MNIDYNKKYTCKKTKTNTFNDHIQFFEGKEYKIEYCTDNTLLVISEKSEFIPFTIGFNTIYLKFFEHFYTESQIRTIKLKKLKNA
jgi:hypothetical protein